MHAKPVLFWRSLLHIWKKSSSFRKKLSSLQWSSATSTRRKCVLIIGINFKDAYYMINASLIIVDLQHCQHSIRVHINNVTPIQWQLLSLPKLLKSTGVGTARGVSWTITLLMGACGEEPEVWEPEVPCTCWEATGCGVGSVGFSSTPRPSLWPVLEMRRDNYLDYKYFPLVRLCE